MRVPIIPWDAYVSCGLKVHVSDKIKIVIFTPQTMETPEEVFQTLRFLMASNSGGKPGPIAWETVPDIVKRHFTFPGEAGAPSVDISNLSQ